MAKDYLELKWGTLKGWNLVSSAAIEALEHLASADLRSMSVMTQHDTHEQQQALLNLIDAIDGEIWLDWDNKRVSKDDAKKYVLEYGKDD